MTAADRDAVTEVYVNIGKSIAAFERGLMPGPTRFDAFVEALLADRPEAAGILTADEIAGLRLFIGEAHCTNCHNGPLFTNNSFHNTGVPPVDGQEPDRGRARRHRSGAGGRVQLPEPVERRRSRRLHGAALPARRRRRAGRSLQAADAPQRVEGRPVHARRPARDARRRPAPLPRRARRPPSATRSSNRST